MRIRELLLATLLVLVATTVARADDSRQVARAHYARGLDLAGKDDYAEALQEFNQAYIVSPDFAVLYNIGQCHIALGHPTEAIEALSRYLRDGADRIPAARRKLVHAQVETLEAHPTGSAEVPAAASGARDLARARVARGIELARRNQYGAALAELEQAWATDPDVETLYNIGQCHLALGHPLEAIEAFSRYLREGGERVPAARADLLGVQLAALESRLAELTIIAVGPEARVVLDGRDLGRTPLPHSLRLGAGSYHLSLMPDVGPVAHRDVALGEAEHQVLKVRLPFLPAGWTDATAARVAASSAAAARAAGAAIIANDAAVLERVRGASSQQGGSGSNQGGSAGGR